MRISLLAISMALIFSATGCAAPPQTADRELSSTTGTTLVETGYIVEVRDVTVHENRSNPLSSVAGALLGGIAGSMIGSGSGQAIATVGGAAGGSIAAQELARSGSTSLTRITVQLDNGRLETVDADPKEAFHTGERVQVMTHNGKRQIVRPAASR